MTTSEPRVILVEAGCAECGVPEGQPLIEGHAFASVEDAKRWCAAWVDETDWVPHPQGGEHYVYRQGSVWIMPHRAKESA